MVDIIIIGGGAAGLMSALIARRRGLTVSIVEPNAKLGRKLRITGKGRCNVTNHCSVQEFLKNVPTNPKFLKSALYAFPPSAAMDFFEQLGVSLKTERGARVFPVSDKADEVADALEQTAKSEGVRHIRARAKELLTENGAIAGIKTDQGIIECRAVILCTGGLSYPGTGSTGDGYRLAESVGHEIMPLRPSLVPLLAESVCEEMQGLSLRNTELSLYRGDKLLYRELGELLFTHFGLSGPLVLSASSYLHGDPKDCRIELDLKPGLTEEKLDERILRDFGVNNNKDYVNSLDALLPQKMIPVVVERSGIPARCKVNSITRAQRLGLVNLLKHFPIRITGFRPIDEAIITSGGVNVSEINPRTMESRLCPGLFFAGEILDADAYTGGFNLQIAWSTAYCAANSVISGV